MTTSDEQLLRRAIELASASVGRDGGPFGAVVARGGRVLAEATNRVTLANDPTAHAEIEAVRAACRELGTFRLEGCTVYASCEPCPMCLGALYWARIERLVFAASRADAAAAGFDDAHFYSELTRPAGERALVTVQLLSDEGRAPLESWVAKMDRTRY
jgi:tRNA(Arg) A34 adenosine deaminase TadA